MNKKVITFNPHTRPIVSHLEPIVDTLLGAGNKLARDYWWGEDRTGYFCLLEYPLDFALIENTFVLPEFIRIDRANISIECDLSWASKLGLNKRKYNETAATMKRCVAWKREETAAANGGNAEKLDWDLFVPSNKLLDQLSLNMRRHLVCGSPRTADVVTRVTALSTR